MASILSIAVGGARKTHVMYRAKLCHSQLQRYLILLESRGLVRAVANAPLYEATERGMQFLRDYKKLGRYLDGTDPILAYECSE